MIPREVTSRRKRCATDTDGERNVDELVGGNNRDDCILVR